MTDAEISRKLALAIGYREHDIHDGTDGLLRARVDDELWKVFDYRDPAVIWPIAKHFDCFPQKWFAYGQTTWRAWNDSSQQFVYTDTPEKAVALAVIKAHEAKP